MQVLEAGTNKYLLLELDPEFIGNIARQAGFDFKIDDQGRVMSLDLAATERQAPLLLFDAADPGNLGWFSRCQFYVDGNRAPSYRRRFRSPISATGPGGLCRMRFACKSPKSCLGLFACPDANPCPNK